MATGLEGWLFGYAGTKLADRILEKLRGDKLTSDLHEAVDKWASELPATAELGYSHALFPSHISDDDLGNRPGLAHLRALIRVPTIPRSEDWKIALLEQWRHVRQSVPEPQSFFRITENEALKYLDSLSRRLSTVCAQHESLFRATTIDLLREILAKFDDADADLGVAVERTLSSDQKKLIRRLSQYEGLCKIAPAKGEYECLWVPGPFMDMQWGWERAPGEAELSGRPRGSRGNRLHWIYVVKDLVAAGILQEQGDEKGIFALTEQGWRVAHSLSAD